MQLWKTIRIFISSTFRDMHAERDFLVRFVFPELRERCAKRNLHLIDVDLRWGVTEEEAKQGKVIEICFDEIERCRPFFIGLLGERYGWMPEKFEVSDDEKFDWLSEYRGHSVTALEIYHGVLRDEEMKTRAFFYFRNDDFLKEIPAENRVDFLPESDDAAQKLNDLKQEINAKNYPVFENYPCRFDGIDESGRVKLADLEEFGNRVLEDLWTAICLEQPEDETPPDDLAIERSFHETFIENRTTRFIGRREVLDKLNDFAKREDENLLVVTGAAGCGKSAVLAKFAKEFAEKHAEDFVLTHFIGVSPGSTDVRRTLLRLCRELKRKFEIQEEIPTDYYELRQAFVIFLEQAAESGKVLLILDALNQLDAQHFAHQLDWLLSPLPKGVKIIVSTLEGDCLDALRRRNPQPREVLIGSLTEAERREIVTKTLKTYRKTLDENQMRLLLAKRESDNPLFLIVACEELRVYGDFDTVSVKLNSLAEQVETLFGQVLERVEHDHGKDLVTDALVLLECSRYGLLESEMLELLARNGEKQLPQAVWARFYRSLNFYLRPSGNNENQSGEGLLDFFHRQLSKAVRQKYLLDKEIEIATHQRLARYFQLKADPKVDKTWSGDYPRALSELPYHCCELKDWNLLHNILSDLTFLQLAWEVCSDQMKMFWTKLEANSNFTISDSFEQIVQEPKTNPDYAREVGLLLKETGHLDDALTLGLGLITHYQTIGDPSKLASALGNVAVILRTRNPPEQALYFIERAEEIYRQLGDLLEVALSLGNRGTILCAMGRIQEALRLHEREAKILRQLKSWTCLQISLGNQAGIHQMLGDSGRALELIDEKTQICLAIGKLDGYAKSLGDKAVILSGIGELQKALELHKQEEKIFRELGDQAGLEVCLMNKALVLYNLDNSVEAKQTLEAHWEICQQIGASEGKARNAILTAEIMKKMVS